MKGYVALCSRSQPGLILFDEPCEVTYPDGNKGTAYIGIHLSPELFGKPWSSRNPKLLYRAYDSHRCVERAD